MRAGNIVEAQKAAILAALRSPTSCSTRARRRDELAESMKRLSAEIRPWLPPANEQTALES